MRIINFRIFLALILLATGCNKIGGLASREPSANDCKKVIENFTAGQIQVLEVEKIRTYETTWMGDPVCKVDLKAKIKYMPIADPTEPYYYMLLDIPFGDAGKIGFVNVTLDFKNTNKGFLGRDGNMY